MSVEFVARLAGEHFGRHVGGGAGNVGRRKIFEARHPHDAEIDQLERAFAFEDHIVRLDITMDDAGVVQRRDRTRQLDGDVAPLFQAQCGTPRQPCFQKFALIERHHRVETGLPAGWQFNRTANPRAVHPRTNPGLADEGGAVSIHGRDLWLGKFQRHFAAFDSHPWRRTSACSVRRTSAL